MASRPTTARPFSLHPLTADALDSELAQARELLLEYGSFVIAQPGAPRFCFGSLEQEAARLPHTYLDQDGGCLLAEVQSQPAGFVA